MPSRPPASSAEPDVPGGEDAVEEQHDFGAFAQHREADHDGERGQRLGAFAHRRADAAHFGGDLAAVPRHPGVVPHQHDDGDAEHAGIEQFLAGALERFRNDAGEHAPRSRRRARRRRCRS